MAQEHPVFGGGFPLLIRAGPAYGNRKEYRQYKTAVKEDTVYPDIPCRSRVKMDVRNIMPINSVAV